MRQESGARNHELGIGAMSKDSGARSGVQTCWVPESLLIAPIPSS